MGRRVALKQRVNVGGHHKRGLEPFSQLPSVPAGRGVMLGRRNGSWRRSAGPSHREFPPQGEVGHPPDPAGDGVQEPPRIVTGKYLGAVEVVSTTCRRL